MNVAHEQGMGYIFTLEQAEHLLHILEPLQVGYGAVVSAIPRALTTACLMMKDHILPRRHPLGPRVGELRREKRRHASLHDRRSCSSSCMAHYPYAG